jgi:hypothetical protein
MPHYFFDVEHRGRRVRDELGMDLDALSFAMREAVSLLNLLAFESRSDQTPRMIRVTIREQVTGSFHEIALDCGRS